MKKGFTLIELLVLITIIAILSTMAITNFSYLQSLSTFRGDVDNLFESIMEARSNAIGQKKCPSGESEAWIFEIDTTVPKTTIICQLSEDGSLENVTDVPLSLHTEPLPRNAGSNIYPVTINRTGTPLYPTKARLIFLTNVLQTKISFLDSNGNWDEESGNDIKMTFQHTQNKTDPEKKTICFNRTQGFPEINKNGVDCPY